MKHNRPKSKNPSVKLEHGSDHELTPNQKSVRQVLAHAKKPLSVYDIIPILSNNLGHSVTPVTVYRALKHLVDCRIITRIESKNAYMLCQHPHETHDCLLFICNICGSATEMRDHAVSHRLLQESRVLNFIVNRAVIEILGQCHKCSKHKS